MILTVCVLLVVLLILRNDKDNKVGIVGGIILIIGLLIAAYLFFGKVDDSGVFVHEAMIYLGGLI